MKPEATFQSKLLRALRSHAALKDAVVLKLNADATTKGIPDVMISLRGVTTFFELKCEPNEATKIQVWYLKRLAPRAYIAEKRRDGSFYLYRISANGQAYMKDCPIDAAYTTEAFAEKIVEWCVNG